MLHVSQRMGEGDRRGAKRGVDVDSSVSTRGVGLIKANTKGRAVLSL